MVAFVSYEIINNVLIFNVFYRCLDKFLTESYVFYNLYMENYGREYDTDYCICKSKGRGW